MYDNYIFDLYGTLIDINTDEYNEDLWQKMTVLYGYRGALYSAGQLRSEYNRLVEKEKAAVHRKFPQFKYIDIDIEKVFRKLYTQKGINPKKSEVLFSAQAFRCYSTKYIKLYDGVIDLLNTLKSKNKRIFLLSNAQRCFTENEINMLGLTEYFDGICISSDEKCSKPDANFFEILFNRYELKKEQSVMIGNDTSSDILGAENFGIDSLYIHQNISPEIKGEISSNYKILDGNVYKIKKLLLGD